MTSKPRDCVTKETQRFRPPSKPSRYSVRSEPANVLDPSSLRIETSRFHRQLTPPEAQWYGNICTVTGKTVCGAGKTVSPLKPTADHRCVAAVLGACRRNRCDAELAALTLIVATPQWPFHPRLSSLPFAQHPYRPYHKHDIKLKCGPHPGGLALGFCRQESLAPQLRDKGGRFT